MGLDTDFSKNYANRKNRNKLITVTVQKKKKSENSAIVKNFTPTQVDQQIPSPERRIASAQAPFDPPLLSAQWNEEQQVQFLSHAFHEPYGQAVNRSIYSIFLHLINTVAQENKIMQ